MYSPQASAPAEQVTIGGPVVLGGRFIEWHLSHLRSDGAGGLDQIVVRHVADQDARLGAAPTLVAQPPFRRTQWVPRRVEQLVDRADHRQGAAVWRELKRPPFLATVAAVKPDQTGIGRIGAALPDLLHDECADLEEPLGDPAQY